MTQHNPTLEKVYDPRAIEGQVYALWEASGAFRSVPDGRPHEQTFTIVIPPPNVTGALHLGHALNNTLQDILIRYHRMRGFNTLWQPGTDHAGIATQAVVERLIREQERKTRHELGRDELVGRIWQWKDRYEARILSQLKAMGCSCDWERNRFTLDEGLSVAVRHMFFRLFKDGLIFRGKRLVNWDTQLQTAVSDDEVYHETIQGHFWYIKYPILPPDAQNFGDAQPAADFSPRGPSIPDQSANADPQRKNDTDEPRFVIIATTRPETMLGDTAVAVHPDPERFFEEQQQLLANELAKATAKEREILQARLGALLQRRDRDLPRLIRLRDMARAGRKVLLPLVDRPIPLICDQWADPTRGTGCVKITPAHDPNDYEVGLRHKLPRINVLTPDGRIARIIEPDGTVNPHSGDYEGLTFSGAGREKVVADLNARGLLEAVEDHEVEIGHSDRSKLPIEPFLSDQWFIRTGDAPSQRAADFSPRGHSSAGPPPYPNPRENTDSQRAAHFSPRGPTNSEGAPFTRRPTPDLGAGAVLITWTTYGTWLPGDQRGFVVRVPSPQAPHPIHNLPGEQYDADDPQALGSALQRREGEPVYLDPAQAQLVLATIARVCARHGIEPLAVAVMANHAHILCQTDRPKNELLKLFKGNVTRALNARFQLQDAPRWFTKGGSVRYSTSRGDLTQAMEYVRDQPHALASWSFAVGGADFDAALASENMESGDAPGTGKSARTEVRGSLGLARAAMDAVQSGRIQVFPQRYARSYLDWLAEKRDWCISRQLWWGHRIPVWTATLHSRGLDERRGVRTIMERIHERVTDLQSALDELGIIAECPHEISVVTNPNIHTLCYILTLSERARRQLSDIQSGMSRARDVALFEPDDYSVDRITEGDPRYDISQRIRSMLSTLNEDEDVLDTWFSSALWPFSTLGWPEDVPHLKQYYPTSVLCTSRDIITNWVARMVMFGLYATGEVPFDRVYIHPKILDGRGETMSKSKGNGVDPMDIIHTHGADALRYSLADMTTETQDIRMPVEYVCPHCGSLVDQSTALAREEQARKSRGMKPDRRLQPSDCTRVRCTSKSCGKELATQWADSETRQALGLGRETSEKFDIGRNFCNKLWNAARFAFMNLSGTPCERFHQLKLLPEDRWILAKLSQTIRAYHECVRQYQFSASVKVLRDFFWDALCDWYIELTKPRMAGRGDNSAEKGTQAGNAAGQVLAFCLDQALRLMHPTIPFITEQLWQRLNGIVPRRGMPGVVEPPCETPLVLAAFPPVEGYPALDDPGILKVFDEIQDVVRAIRDLRLRCGVPVKQAVTATVVLPREDCAAFGEHAHIVRHMAGVEQLHVDPEAKRPVNAASVTVGVTRVFVHGISDDEAERTRTTRQLAAIERQIAAKESKLGNEKFVAHARPEVVEAERQRLAELLAQQTALTAHLDELGQ